MIAGDPDWITMHEARVVVAVKAVPRSRRTQAVGIQDGHLRVQIAAVPHDGRSNAALCAYLAAAAGVRPSAVRLRRGSTGARKLIEIEGPPDAVRENLRRAFAEVAP